MVANFALITLALSLTLSCDVLATFEGRRGELFSHTEKGVLEYMRTGRLPEFLKHPETTYQYPHIFRQPKVEEKRGIVDDTVCSMCGLVVDEVINVRRQGTSKEELVDLVTTVCTVLGIEPEEVCRGVIEANADIFVYIVDNRPDMNHERVCSLVLTNFNCSKGDNYEWTLEIPESSATLAQIQPEPTEETIKILHLSDVHYDPLYQAGKNAKCNEPLCCQADHEDPASSEDACGYWLEYATADPPMNTVAEIVRQANTQDFDYVYFTGDVVSHRVWSTSVANNSHDIINFYDHLAANVKKPLYPVFGNHEPHPMNVWGSNNASDPLSVAWLLELAADNWATWLPEETRETILRGGYYTVSPQPGFRIIALNGNVGYNFNFWLMYDDRDPYGQLEWLIATLLEAEQNNERVHILSHVPSGDDMLAVWAREYRRVINRFAKTISAQFNGHTHIDQFKLYYGEREHGVEATSVALNGASMTAYSNSNPSFKIYTVESSAFNVADFEEWTFNLTAANLVTDQPLDFYRLYSFRETYGVESLIPSEIGALVERMAGDAKLLEEYYTFKHRNSDPANVEGCDDECNKSNLCEIVTTVPGDNSQCEKLTQLYEARKK